MKKWIIIILILIAIIAIIIILSKKSKKANSNELSASSLEDARNIMIPFNQLDQYEQQERLNFLSGFENEKTKTATGRVLHDVGATVLKGLVQPFASFSDKEKHRDLFYPKLQTKSFAKINKGIDVFDKVGHMAGQWFTGTKTKGAITFKDDKAQADYAKLGALAGQGIKTSTNNNLASAEAA